MTKKCKCNLREKLVGDGCDICNPAKALEYARAALAEAEKDAARYRWLREQNWYSAELCVVTRPKKTVQLGTLCPSLEQLDALIDFVMED